MDSRKCWVCRYPVKGEPEWVRGYVVGWALGGEQLGDFTKIKPVAIVEDPTTHRVRTVELDDISFAETPLVV